MTTSTYQIADSEELDAFGADETYDTSAALPMDAPVETTTAEVPSSSGKRRWCLCLVVLALTLGAIAAFLGVFFGLKDNGKASPNENVSPPDQQPVDAPPNLPATNPPPVTAPSSKAKKYAVKVVRKFPHDTSAFTQGFEFKNGFFYESTGLRGQSSLRKVEIATGKVVQHINLKDMTLFGEGMTLHEDRHIYMLTWQAGRGFVFNQTTFEVIREWSYPGEGWGLTMDRQKGEIYMSDGTTYLRVLQPETLKELRRVKVTLNGAETSELNEIEWICGEVWANVWMTSKIYRIDPSTGVVKSIIDARILPLKGDRTPAMDVLNGIAFDKDTGRIWLTGKKWSTIYEVNITDDSMDFKNCKN